MTHALFSHGKWPTFVRSAGAAAALALGASGCGSAVDPTGASTANPLDSGEGALVVGLNGHRAEAGIPALTVCKSLNISASAHSDDMRDFGYQSDVGRDGSTVKTRACKAGYAPACSGNAMAELIASGSGDPDHTVGQWKGDGPSNAVLLDPAMKIMGVGLSADEEKPVWTVDLAAVDDPSCL